MAENKKTEGLIYKNHPLRRIDNIIYYGSMADKYIIMLQILDTKKEQDMDVATRVSVQLQLTDPDLKSRDRVVKKSEKDSLYAAMDVGLHLAGAGSGREISERKGVRHDTKISAGGAGDACWRLCVRYISPRSARRRRMWFPPPSTWAWWCQERRWRS